MVRPRALDLVDVLAYVLVLGTFTQLFPGVIAESFLLIVLTAVMLKLVLELVLWLKKLVLARVRAARRMTAKVAISGLLLVVLAGSKLAVLELTALVFGDAVTLGGFLEVTLLIVCLMAMRAVLRLAVARRR